MRHQKSGRKLGRNSPHRTAMFRNLAASLLTHETVRTTLPKAKELRRVVEPLITLGKEDSVAHRRLAFSRLRDDAAVGRLFTELGPRFQKARLQAKFKPDGAGTAEQTVDHWLARLIQRPVDAQKRQALIDSLAGRAGDESAIRSMVQLIVSMPEYQLC